MIVFTIKEIMVNNLKMKNRINLKFESHCKLFNRLLRKTFNVIITGVSIGVLCTVRIKNIF